jgi:type III secretion protein S
MENAEIIHQLNVILLLVLYLTAPVLAVAASVGLIVGLLQAVTQVQDHTLPQTIKLVAILLTIVVLGPFLSGSLVNGARNIFNEFPTIVLSSGTSQP